MHVASEGHEFQILPGISVLERWSTFEALDVKDELTSAANTLQPIVNMSKLKLPKRIRLPDSSDQSAEERKSHTPSDDKREVVYIRLRRDECAKQVELKAWKETVEAGLSRREAATANTRDIGDNEDDEAEAELYSFLNPPTDLATTNLMNALQNTEGVTDGSSDAEHGGLEQADTPTPPGSDVPARQVDIINVPKPKTKGKTRSNPKQLRQTKIATRLAVHKYPSDLTVQLYEFVIWARNTSSMILVAEMVDKYPVQLDDAYLRARTIECGWEAMRPAAYMHPFVIPGPLELNCGNQTHLIIPSRSRHPARSRGVYRSQPVEYVVAATTFYYVKTKVRQWFEDRKWLEQDWRKIVSDVDFLAVETGTSGLSSDAVRARHWAMANEVISKFASCRLSAEFVTPSRGCFITFENVVGALCKGWLNDSPIDFCLEVIGSTAEKCHVLSSHTTSTGRPKTPKKLITDTKFIIQPVNLKRSHGGVVITTLHYLESADILRVHPYLYEPVIDEEYHEDMEEVWKGIKDQENKVVMEGLRGFVKRWCQASTPTTKLRIYPIEWVEVPQQPDYASCGVFVVAQAFSYVHGNLQWQHCNVSKTDVQVMRLRMLWLILCKSRESPMARGKVERMKKIHDQLLKELK
ncbi:hypothetical protein F442_14608 [Phytophthora nicotianae P10297]|uniref:Ubiquitin-like protease family profile domain-containing protein n=1 Tax=Phytophthora nicotianae P10297 TaxID=1317064 RepID=W2YRJ9_PHYNI|nr:hypothetical protein F442_14608 [Phytophthora nicotianae P10297]